MRVGTDIIEVSRIQKVFKNTDSQMRVFTQNEIMYANSRKNTFEHLAGFFAVKESVVKAFNMGVISEVEVLHNENGSPYVKLSGNLKTEFEKKYTDIAVSISHCKSHAIAFVVIN